MYIPLHMYPVVAEYSIISFEQKIQHKPLWMFRQTYLLDYPMYSTAYRYNCK